MAVVKPKLIIAANRDKEKYYKEPVGKLPEGQKTLLDITKSPWENYLKGEKHY